MLPGIKQALHHAVLFLHSNMSDNLEQCGQLIGRYLCHYYFPVCNTDGDKIRPVCSSGCNILLNNEECSNMLTDALGLIAEQNITLLPKNDSCAMTYRYFSESDQPDVSQFCDIIGN